MTDKNTSPKVSIIIPTYNRAAFIIETIESIRDQTWQNWELIIVDDGSEDNTEELIAQLDDERIHFYKTGRTGIGGKIKNIGLEKASGELIAFIDSDDLWAPTKLEKQVAALQKYPEAGFSLTGGYNFRERDQPIDHFYKQREGINYDNIFLALFRSEIAAFAQALLLRNECLAVTGTFIEEKSFSDVDFIIALATHFKAVILYEDLVYRRIHEENYIHSTWEKSYYEGIEIIEFYKNNNQLPDAIARDSLFRAHINFGEKYLSLDKKRKAFSQFFLAWKNKPLSIIPLRKIGKTLLRYFKI